MQSEQIHRALGRIEGKLEGLDVRSSDQSRQLVRMDGRLRFIEARSASFGALCGSIAGVMTSVIGSRFKSLMEL